MVEILELQVEDLNGLCIDGKVLPQNKDYVTSDEVLSTLYDAKEPNNVWHHCDYMRCVK